MNTITTIQKHVAHSSLVLFFGADLPATLIGIPSWVDLPTGLVQRHRLPA